MTNSTLFDVQTLVQKVNQLDKLEQVVAKFRVLVVKEQEYITEFRDELSKDELMRHQATLTRFSAQLVDLEKDFSTKREKLDTVLIDTEAQQVIASLKEAYNKKHNFLVETEQAAALSTNSGELLASYNEDLLVSQQLHDRSSEVMALNNIGSIYRYSSELDKAISFYQQALILEIEIGDVESRAVTLNNLADIYQTLGDLAVALDYYEQALVLNQSLNDQDTIAITLRNIGKIHAALGERDKALSPVVNDQAKEVNTQQQSKQLEDKTQNAK